MKSQHKFKSITLPSLKVMPSESGNGRLEGYANVFNVVDSYNDVTMPGAFALHLQEFVDKGFLLTNHDWDYECACGFIVEAREDEKGLFFVAEFHGDPESQAIRQKTSERMNAGKEVGLSIGYWVLSEETGSFNGAQVNFLKELRVREVSIVVAQANEESMGTGIKQSRKDQHEAIAESAKAYLSRIKEINDLGRSDDWKQERADEFKALGALFMKLAEELTPVPDAQDDGDGDALAALALLDAELVTLKN